MSTLDSIFEKECKGSGKFHKGLLLANSYSLTPPAIVMEGYKALPCHPCDKSAPLTVYTLMTWK